MPPFSHRALYVNFAEHLQNAWNPNLYFPGAPNRWSTEDWRGFFCMLKAFGFTCFEYWVPPTLFHPDALAGAKRQADFAATMREVNALAHDAGLQAKYICAVNTIGAEWFFACPNDPDQRRLILDLWRHWARELANADIVGIFPGDPGGCNRNGCTHETFLELALELCAVIKGENPEAIIELGTWGTPFTGWGDDMRTVPEWQGDWASLIDETHNTPEVPCHIWNGKRARAHRAISDLLTRLPDFPEDTWVAINLGLDPDGGATMGGDARAFAREIAKLRPITTWDYSLAEGELIVYPHWRLPRMAARRREECAAAPYIGGMSYTMSPKLNLLTMYAAGQFFLDPDGADPDRASRDFCAQVFGEEHAILGELFEAFEVVHGWGHYPRRAWDKARLREAYDGIIAHLEAADMTRCTLPLFPDPESYRQDLLWFARHFRQLASDAPDRTAIRQTYAARTFAIYDTIPMSADVRAPHAAAGFAGMLP
jgi:hypothetical protein